MRHPRNNKKSCCANYLSLIATAGLSNSAYSYELASDNTQHLLLFAVALMAIQFILIIGLQRSRLKNKDAKNTLKNHQKDLEQKILERTQSLHQKNLELEAAIHSYKQIAVQLQDTKRHVQTMINSVPEILVGVDEKGKVTYWNTAAYEKTGLSFDKALGTHILSAMPYLPIAHEQLAHIIKYQISHVNQHIQQIENDEYRYYDLRIHPLSNAYTFGAVIQLNDITKRRQFENMMIQNEKMSSLGELAAGIAHEINNPLGIILHNTQNIIRRTMNDLSSNAEAAQRHSITLEHLRNYFAEREIDKFLENIQEAGERASTIVSNMLEFSRSNHSEKNWVDVKKLVEQSIEFHIKSNFTEDSIDQQVVIQTHISDKLPQIFASASELQQVLINLLHNADQALTSNDYEKADELRISISIYANDNEVIIEVSDNGPGIKDTIKDHIFEPFFTTKDVGKGTGLGLSVSYFIITEHHHGLISVKSQIGKGTTFKIRLPISDDQNPSTHL